MTEVEKTEEVKEETEVSNKEYNFRALEAKYEKQLQDERDARLKLEEQIKNTPVEEEEEEDDDPYIDQKKLEKKLAKFGEKAKQHTKTEIKTAIHEALSDERKNTYLINHPDFYDTLTKYSDKLVEKNPQLAEIILNMPEGFERQKLVYHNIKALNLENAQAAKSDIQEKIDRNNKGYYYQPSGIGNAPHNPQGDYSPSGQKAAYERVQALKKNLRLS